jgi:DNA polymerase-3 subunit alpha
MLSFANYAFNKSHAAAYAVISYRTAYLKAHYPKEYMSSMLTSVFGNTAKMNEYVSECSRMGIQVLAPDINESKLSFTVSENGIRFGLLDIKNAGRPFIETILNERRKGCFTSFENFVERMSAHSITKRQLEFLIKCGAFDKLGVFRSQLLNSYEKILDEINAKNHENITGQIDIFSSLFDQKEKSTVNSSYVYPDIPEFNIRELLILEKESSGMYFSGHILDGYKKHINSVRHVKIADIKDSFDDSQNNSHTYQEKERVTILGVINRRVNKVTKNGSKMAFLTLEDTSSEINIIVFSKELEKLGDILYTDMTVLITGTVTKKDEEEVEIILLSAESLLSDSDFENKKGLKETGQAENKKLYIRVSSMGAKECKDALEIIQSYKGSTPVVIYSGEDKKYYNSKNTCVDVSDALKERLTSILGKENVILK